MGVLPLGCTPRIVWDWKNAAANDERGCVEAINKLVIQYNIMLEEHITELNSAYPDAHIIFCDVYQGIMEIIDNPLHFGMKSFPSLLFSSLK